MSRRACFSTASKYISLLLLLIPNFFPFFFRFFKEWYYDFIGEVFYLKTNQFIQSSLSFFEDQLQVVLDDDPISDKENDGPEEEDEGPGAEEGEDEGVAAENDDQDMVVDEDNPEEMVEERRQSTLPPKDETTVEAILLDLGWNLSSGALKVIYIFIFHFSQIDRYIRS